jgi:dTMP kinase
MSTLIVFEGLDGCGKTTQMDLLEKHYRGRFKVERLRDPGSTTVGDKIRDILLHPDHEISAKVELFLFMAARGQLASERIWPALEAGKLILLDRYYYSTMAYQGASGKLHLDYVRDEVAFLELPEPTLVLYFDGDPKIFAKRRAGAKDRIERKGLAYQKAVRAEYLKIAERYDFSFKIIDATKPVEEVFGKVLETMETHLASLGKPN